ncbi:MAG: hypothetical protein ACE5K7_05040, partial [Phycisphaerae bacterium]
AIAAMGLAVHQPQAGFALRATLTIGFAFAVIVAAGLQRREADREVIEAIEQQRHQARRQAARELAALLPAIGLAAACGLAAWRSPALLGRWMAALDWSPLGQWRPISGLATSLAGFALAGAIGWTIRLLFTLLLGKEAFGLGDIHLMAAAGAVAGWQVVLIGFVMAAPLALAGVVLLLARKRSQAIPFGPWLGLGVWVALLYHDAIVGWVGPFLVGGLEGLRLLAAHLTGTAR